MLRYHDLVKRFNVDPATIRRWVQHKKFPQPTRKAHNDVYWREAEVQAWEQKSTLKRTPRG